MEALNYRDLPKEVKVEVAAALEDYRDLQAYRRINRSSEELLSGCLPYILRMQGHSREESEMPLEELYKRKISLLNPDNDAPISCSDPVFIAVNRAAGFMKIVFESPLTRTCGALIFKHIFGAK